jgi:hypothetical protein
MAVEQPKGRRTIRKPHIASVFGTLEPDPGQTRKNAQIRMWHLGDHDESTTLGKLQRAYQRTLDSVDQVDARKKSAAESGKLTEAGIKDAVRSFTLNDVVQDYQTSHKAIAAARQEAATLRDSIKLEPTDRTDMVGFLRRQEMRAHLKAMPIKERNQFISKHRENLEPEMALAICEMPSAFSGVLDGDRTDLMNRALQAQHGQKIAELEKLQDAITIAESAVDAGAEELRLEAGFNNRADFEKAVEKAKPPSYRPWLKKYTEEDGREVVRAVKWDSAAKTSGTWSIATADEIARGQFFESREAYDRANAGLAA